MPDESNGKQPPAFHIHYIKTSNYREIACDGVVGGVTPRARKIWMGFYSERSPIPRTVFHQTAPGAAPNEWVVDESKPPFRVESREGLIRNIEVATYIDLETAKRLVEWLQKRVTDLEGKDHGSGA